MSLPEIEMTRELQGSFNRLYLDFLSSLYLGPGDRKNTEARDWLLKEIAYYLKLVYPEKSRQEMIDILVHINQQAREAQ